MQLSLVHLGCGAPPLIVVNLLLSSEVSHNDGHYAEQHAESGDTRHRHQVAVACLAIARSQIVSFLTS